MTILEIFSPINIVSKDALKISSSPIRVEIDEKVSVTTTYKNDGHGFAAKVVFANGANPNITGGILGNEKYTFFNFHVHWPSEHTLDGNHFPAELHIVHYNLKYGSIGEAITKSDGLAVVGIFFEVKTYSQK